MMVCFGLCWFFFSSDLVINEIHGALVLGARTLISKASTNVVRLLRLVGFEIAFLNGF